MRLPNSTGAVSAAGGRHWQVRRTRHPRRTSSAFRPTVERPNLLNSLRSSTTVILDDMAPGRRRQVSPQGP